MTRALALSGSSSKSLYLSDPPPDIVQDVQVVPATSLSLEVPRKGPHLYRSEPPPDITQDVQVVQVTVASSALAAPQTAELSSTIERLRSEGASDSEIREFLKKIGTSYTFAMGGDRGVSVTLPGGHLLSPLQSQLLLAAITTEMGVASPALAPMVLALFKLLPAVATRFNVTIGIGPAVSGAIATGTSLGAGIMFAPDDRVGFYGSLDGVLGAIVSISATMQVTIVHGDADAFSGAAVAITIGGGEEIVGSATVLLTADSSRRFLGVTFSMGVGAGLTPIEAYAQYQYTSTSLS